MKFSKQVVYGVLFVEMQIILILLFFLVSKVIEVEQKVQRTNQFLYTAINDNKVTALQNISQDDIVIGDINAPATMYLYTRFDCSACSDFYSAAYQQLQEEFVETGLLKIVVRYLTHVNNKDAFYAARCAQYAYLNNTFPTYNQRIVYLQSKLSIPTIRETTLNLIPDSIKLDSFLKDESKANVLFNKAREARIAGISSTPTIIINGQVLIGNRRFKKLAQLINEDLMR